MDFRLQVPYERGLPAPAQRDGAGGEVRGARRGGHAHPALAPGGHAGLGACLR